MLTTLERDYLETGKTEDTSQKKNLNHRIKNKLPQIDEELTDVKLILDNYSEELVKNTLSKETLSIAMSILERALEILDPWPVGEHEEGEARAFRIWGSEIPANEPGDCTIQSISRSSIEEEIVFHKRLEEHFEKIRFFVDPCIPDPICRDPEYIGTQEEKTFQFAKDITNKTGKPLSVSLDAYIDDIGINSKRWVIRAPVAIQKETLKAMRWKPRGLKECMKLPPLLKEKKIPGLWTAVASIKGSSTHEEDEKFKEAIQKQNEEPELTEKELLEINERIKKIPRSDEEPK
jgi:hypothetical protein